VRKVVLAACLTLVAPALLCVSADPASADFDPSGRKRPPPKPPGGVRRPPPRKPPPAGPAVDKRSPDALIKRYTGIVLSQPAAPFPLQRLSQLYRERDGNLKKLVVDFESRAAGDDDDAWSARVALAGIYKQDGRHDDAIKTYETAITQKPDAPAPLMALAHLREDKGDTTEARALYEKALPLLKVGAEIEQTRRVLMSLSLDLKDFEAAKEQHAELIKRAKGSLFVKAELGRALMSRGHHERAESEFRELVKAATGDNRALAPALRDLGQALAKQKKTAEALKVLKRALSIAGGATGVRREVLHIMTDAFRVDGKLAELIEILEKEPGQDFSRLATMGALYEETGNVDKALSTYRKALGIDSRNIDVRLKLVHLLQTAGELEQAIKEYEALIKAAPNNSDFVFELCETLIQRGDRPKALRLLQQLEGRVANEPEVLATVADFYERVEESDRAMAVLKKLANASGGDPHHIIDLGDRYYQAGDKKKALETWARLKSMIPSRARAAATLGDVYLDHDMGSEAIAELRDAVKLEPKNKQFQKQLAVALERTASSSSRPKVRYAEARSIWETLLQSANSNKLLAREARTHIVSLWALTRELPSRVTPLKTKFEQTPPDLEAGRLLAEVQRKLHRLADAEATLRRIVETAPGDEQSLLALERVLVQQQNIKGAIQVLEKLAEANPKRARQYFQRMAQYAADLSLDDDAIRYASKAVELSPNDANGHHKLGDMYRRRQDTKHAIAEYRQAIAKNDRLFSVYFDLAELLLSSGEVDDADRLFRRVVRASRDEELVARAARMSMQLNLAKGTLESLERELLPVAVGNPQRPLYRRLLVELYGAMTMPLVQKVRRATADAQSKKEATEARAKLAKIGARAVKPLLDALADNKEAQQKVAIEVLAYVENKSAGPSLFNFATGQADKNLRVRAMVATGALRDPALLERFTKLLAPSRRDATMLSNDAVAVAGTWSVARMQSTKAEKLLTTLVSSPSPDVRAIAALGLGLTANKKHAARLAQVARSPEAGATARAAAIFALGELGRGARSSDTSLLLSSAAEDNDASLRRAALLTSARLAPMLEDPALEASTRTAIAATIFSPDAALRQTAVTAAAALASKTYPRSREPLPVPDGPLTLRGVLRDLGPDEFGAEDRARALVALAPQLTRAAVAAVATSPDRAIVVADALAAAGSGLTPFLDADDELSPELTRKVERAASDIANAVVPGFASLVRHPVVAVRMRAVEFLAHRAEPVAQAAVIDSLDDPEDAVRRAALAAIGSVDHGPTVDAVAVLALRADSWPLRVRASEALGRLGRRPGQARGANARIVATLGKAARHDAYALVREAALTSLASVDRTAALPILREAAAKDAEPRVQQAAAKLLKEARR